MKYFTKEYQNSMGKTNIHLLMRATKKAENFDQQYYEDLYEKELKNFLEEQKEICEMDEEDLFDESDWDEISVMDEKGNMVNVKEFMSEEEVEELRQSILEDEKEASENFEIEEYDEEKLTKQFKEGHLDTIEYLKRNLPKDILDDVADIRVLALDRATRKIKKRIEKYCKENEKIVEQIDKKYYQYFKTIENKIPANIIENYEFHDCEILSIEKVGDDIIFNLDNSGGFTDINKIIYTNGEFLENNWQEDSYWIYDEIYLTDEGYEFHIGISSNNEYGYDYITLTASDVYFQ